MTVPRYGSIRAVEGVTDKNGAMDIMKMLILGMIAVLGVSGAVRAGDVESAMSQETSYTYGLRPICQEGQTKEFYYNAQGQIIGWKCVW